jgi:hypothetical protein
MYPRISSRGDRILQVGAIITENFSTVENFLFPVSSVYTIDEALAAKGLFGTGSRV